MGLKGKFLIGAWNIGIIESSIEEVFRDPGRLKIRWLTHKYCDGKTMVIHRKSFQISMKKCICDSFLINFLSLKRLIFSTSTPERKLAGMIHALAAAGRNIRSADWGKNSLLD
jgi:hypothetical protein